MITPELKDKVLNKFIESGQVKASFDINQFANELKITVDELELILNQLEKLELAAFYRFMGSRIDFELTADAFDFFRHGGFVAQEQLLKQNLEKLILEIESLKPNFPEKAALWSGIVSAITSALALFK